MKLKDYKVNYKDYQYIDEPMIYVWEELGTGRIIARVFNTGEKADACRLNYARKTDQYVNWCMGVFPVDIDRDFIREWYPEVEFQDDLIEEGRKKRGKDKKPRHRRTKKEIEMESVEEEMVAISAVIPKDLKEKLDNYAQGTGKQQKEIVVEALRKLIEGKESIIEQIRKLQELL